MQIEDLKKMKEIVERLKAKRDSILKMQEEISVLEESEEVKRYLNLLEKLEEEDKTGVSSYTDKKIINIAFRDAKIKSESKIYVYLGTYKYNYEVDIEHGSNDYLVSRTCSDADYALYQDLESYYSETIQVPYKNIEEFESTHKIIIPKYRRHFYELQSEYIETMILDSPEAAYQMINKLVLK